MYQQFAALRQFHLVHGDGREWPALKLTTPQERGHPSFLREPPNWRPYEIVLWLPSLASSGDSRPATNLLCDLVQVTPLLWASLSLSVKRWGWASWKLRFLPSMALGESMILRTRVNAAGVKDPGKKNSPLVLSPL